MARLSKTEIDDLVREPIISILSSIRPDGTPHMTPVWHIQDSGDVVVAVEKSSVKARNVTRNPKVALCVATSETPQKWVLVNGTARLSEDRVREVVQALSLHYLGVEEGKPYSEKVLSTLDFVLIRISPTGTIGFAGE